jgi:hypothetical protein
MIQRVMNDTDSATQGPSVILGFHRTGSSSPSKSCKQHTAVAVVVAAVIAVWCSQFKPELRILTDQSLTLVSAHIAHISSKGGVRAFVTV